jgi:hypothetical protein
VTLLMIIMVMIAFRYPNMVAARVIVAAAPAIDIDRAREMVDQMLAWVIARHGAWFWTGLQGDQDLKLYA